MRDFTVRKQTGVDKNIFDYYRYVQDEKGADASIKVAFMKNQLKNIDDMENEMQRELPPPRPLLDILNEYMEECALARLPNEREVYRRIGGPGSQY